MRAASSNEGKLAAFAAVRDSDGALTVVVVNKSAGEVIARLSLAGAPGSGGAAAWRLSEANPGGLARVEDVTVSGGSATVSLPAWSATMLVFGGR